MNKKRNILFLLHLPPPVHGSSIIGQSIRSSTLINNTFDCRYINLLVSRTINDTGKTSILKIFRFIEVWFALLMEIIRKKPDVCYLAITATGAAFYKDVLLIAMLRFFRIKRVYHMHNKGVSQHQKKKINEILYHFVFSNAEIILLSNKMYVDIETFVPPSRVHICPNGIKDIASNVNHRILSTDKLVKILFLSNLIESKGVIILLEACSILKKKGINFECNFVGAEGDLNAEQFNKKVSDLGIEKQVKYLGKKYGEEKQKIYEDSDIFAFPTYYKNETFGLVNLEAMQYSLPVISTYEGGIPDIIDENITGFLVPQHNEKALAEKLEVLITNPALCQKMGNAARQKFEKEYTLNIFEHRLIEILEII